jgi:hypothetical protein
MRIGFAGKEQLQTSNLAPKQASQVKPCWKSNYMQAINKVAPASQEAKSGTCKHASTHARKQA